MRIVLLRNGKSGLVLKRKKRRRQIHRISQSHKIHRIFLRQKIVKITSLQQKMMGQLVKKRELEEQRKRESEEEESLQLRWHKTMILIKTMSRIIRNGVLMMILCL
jgi:hypothetical protein